jgi:hypothetical protein
MMLVAPQTQSSPNCQHGALNTSGPRSMIVVPRQLGFSKVSRGISTTRSTSQSCGCHVGSSRVTANQGVTQKSLT